MEFQTIKSDCLKVRQTMFDFLKRKKHQQLQQSLKQFDSASKSQNKSLHQSVSKKQSYYDQIIEQPSSIPLFSNRKNSLGKYMTISPKKITFGQENQVEYRSARRPLVQMLSANKNRNRQNDSSISARQRSQKKAVTNRMSDPLNQNQYSTFQPFMKRKISVSLQKISQKIQQILETGFYASQKNKQLSVALINLVKNLSKENSSSVEKKLGDVKYILNAIDSALSKFSNPSFKQITKLVEDFKQSLPIHFRQLQSEVTVTIRNQYQKKFAQNMNQKQEEISELENQIKKLSRQVQRLSKILEKEEKGHESFINEWQNKFNDLSGKNDQMRLQFTQKERIFTEEISKLTRQLKEQKQISTQLQKELKNISYQHQKYKENELTKRTEQLYARETYLLDEIQSLKLTFNTDISELHKLYESKQSSYQQKINDLTVLLDEQKYKNKCDRQVSDKILAEANNSRKDLSILKKKNQDLIHDLCKVNDQFFKHWLALKDVKTLAQRLNVYKYFEGIYFDVPFDPLLFKV